MSRVTNSLRIIALVVLALAFSGCFYAVPPGVNPYATPTAVVEPDATPTAVAEPEGERGVVRDLRVPGTLTAGSLVVQSQLSIPDGTLSWNDLNLAAVPDLGIDGAVTMGDDLVVDGNAIISGTATLSSTLDVAGAVTLAGGYGGTGCTVSAAGALSCNGAIVTDGTVTAAGVKSTTTVLSKTANYPVLAGDTGDLIVTTNAITLTLPAAAAGLNYCVFNGDGSDIKLDPVDGTDTILVLTNAGGDRLTNTTVGDSICITAIDTTNWAALQRVGTWSDGN